ncbi:MAG: hypothetical protein SV377_03795 [Halobacteria archaeon]|nr:hypothetical protein [Halobacteria archaeon]
MAFVQNVVVVGAFVLVSSLLMHLAARFVLEGAEFKRAVGAVIFLTMVASVLSFFEVPISLSLLTILVVGFITVQTVYQTTTRNTAFIIAVYMVVSVIVVVLIRSLLGLAMSL